MGDLTRRRLSSKRSRPQPADQPAARTQHQSRDTTSDPRCPPNALHRAFPQPARQAHRPSDRPANPHNTRTTTNPAQHHIHSATARCGLDGLLAGLDGSLLVRRRVAEKCMWPVGVPFSRRCRCAVVFDGLRSWRRRRAGWRGRGRPWSGSFRSGSRRWSPSLGRRSRGAG
jgi:hypothetical protein